MKTAACGRIGIILILTGLFLVRLSINYVIFTQNCEWARDRVAAAENSCIEIAGMIAVAEGTIIHADNDWTKIAYFHYWDGAVYNRVIPYENPVYPENTKVMVVYLLGVGPGDCLVSGFYRNRFLACGAVGLIISITGVIVIKITGKEWRIRKWQEKKS